MNPEIYKKIKEEVEKGDSPFVFKRDNNISFIKGDLFHEIIKLLPPHLDNSKTQIPLSTIYSTFFHKPTGGLVVVNKGASLLSKSLLSQRYMVIRHIGFVIYLPNQGIEIVDVGVAGNLQKSKFTLLRPESACSPGFMFGSQRCNCHDQWTLAQELSLEYNSIEKPNLSSVDLEKLLTSEINIDDNDNLLFKSDGQAFIMAHFTSQNGMGSGVMEDIYVSDLTANAFMRHRGEYSAEQIYKTSVAGGFTAIGISPDPRKLNDGLSFKIISTVLDYLNAPRNIIALTNNNDKINAIKNSGYNVQRLQLIGRAGDGCEIEINDRRNEFGHMIPENINTCWKDELVRLKEEIDSIINKA